MKEETMLRRRCALILSALTIATAAFFGFVPWHSAKAWSSPDKTTTPIVFVHGYNDGPGGSCPQVDGNMWLNLQADLREDGWNGVNLNNRVGFYSCDYNMDDYIDYYGSHNTYYSASPCSCSTHEVRTNGHLSHNRNTDIRHLAYHLAWYIWSNFSQYGHNVQIVAHSMGGLIVRWMLYALDNPSTVGQNVFPPRLYIQDIVTVSTPHNGVDYAWIKGTFQTTELAAGSSFINELNSYGTNPQATNGTDWTTMGNYPWDSDLVVNAYSATHMNGGHKILFANPQYSHGSSLNDTNESWNASVYRCDYCPNSSTVGQGNYTFYNNMPHADGYIDQALYHNQSSWPS
jgi:hypothetical protein